MNWLSRREGNFFVALDQFVDTVLTVNPVEPTFFECERMYLAPARLTGLLASLRALAVTHEEAQKATAAAAGAEAAERRPSLVDAKGSGARARVDDSGAGASAAAPHELSQR